MTTQNGIFYPAASAAKPTALQTLSMPELYDTVYHLPPPIIKGFLGSGLQILAGSPKIGKSFFVLRLAYQVAQGNAMFDYQTNKCGVLYLALEDKFHRLQKRLSRMFDVDVAPGLQLAVAANSIENGLEEQLADFIAAYPDVRLVIIDTMQKIRSKAEEQLSYARDYSIGTRLKAIADKHNICLLVVHHTRKQNADDVFEKISGTNGLFGSADGAMILDKAERTSSIATLTVSGRDNSDLQLTLKFNRSRCIWELVKNNTYTANEPRNPLLEAVAKLVSKQNPKWSGTATELVQELSLLHYDIPNNVITRKLNPLATELEQDYGIYYHCTREHLHKKINFTLLDRTQEAA